MLVCSFFSVLLVQLSRETREQCLDTVLNTCVRNVELSVFFFKKKNHLPVCADQVQNSSGIMTDCCRTSVVLSSVHKSKSVVKCILCVRRTGLKSCPSVSPVRYRSAASFRIHVIRHPLVLSQILSYSRSQVFRLVNSAKIVYVDLKLENPRTLSSARSVSENSPRTFEQCETFVSFFRALCEVRDVLFGNLRVLWKTVRYRVRHIWLTCLHREFVLCETYLP